MKNKDVGNQIEKVNVIVDIDGTLFNDFLRRKYIGVSWSEYHERACEDPPIYPIIKIVNTLSDNGFNIIALTARPIKYERSTNDQLIEQDVKFNQLYMRNEGDKRSRVIVKRDHIINTIGVDSIFLAIDDHEETCEMYSELGIANLQIKINRSYK